MNEEWLENVKRVAKADGGGQFQALKMVYTIIHCGDAIRCVPWYLLTTCFLLVLDLTLPLLTVFI